ncbi:MAG: MoaD/ThiS family protein [Crocinitomicaceae bacterium]|nr:MoaD/ThiS family protein [Crocinitomicaceae bacterium]
MKLTIKYFGLLAEITGLEEERLNIENKKIGGLIDAIINKHPGLKGREFQIAQNKKMVNKEDLVNGEEIALLPPFSGG